MYQLKKPTVYTTETRGVAGIALSFDNISGIIRSIKDNLKIEITR